MCEDYPDGVENDCEEVGSEEQGRRRETGGENVSGADRLRKQMAIPGEERHRILDTFSTALKVLEAPLS